MKLRIAIWASIGALVAIVWRLYLSATFPTPLSGAMRTLADLTCPIALARHLALNFYSVLVVNAATYAVAGAIVEILRRHYRRPFQAKPAN